MNDVATQVRQHLGTPPGAAAVLVGLSNDDSLVDAGLLDSLALFNIASFVEERFGIEVADEELVPEAFGTINAVVALIERKLAAASLRPVGN